MLLFDPSLQYFSEKHHPVSFIMTLWIISCLLGPFYCHYLSTFLEIKTNMSMLRKGLSHLSHNHFGHGTHEKSEHHIVTYNSNMKFTNLYMNILEQ